MSVYSHSRRRWQKLPSHVRAHLPLVIAAGLTIFPFYVMGVLSLQSGQGISLPGSLFPVDVNLDAYRQMLNSSEVARWLWNTTVYSVVSVVLVLLLSSLAAYAFAKHRFRGHRVIFWVLVSMMMVPYHLQLIPQFILISRLDGLGTYWGLIVPTLANVQALFLMRQFIAYIPDDFLEAARIDGANEFRVYWHIVLPQCRPIIATLGVFVFLWHWNDFLWPLVAAPTSDMYTLTVGLNTLQAQETSLATIMAGAMITFLPVFIIFLFMQRHFERGAMLSGIK